MLEIEKENPSLKVVLPKDYARESLDKHRLGELIDLIGTIGLGDKESRSKDVLCRVPLTFSVSLLLQGAKRACSSTPLGAWSSCYERVSKLVHWYYLPVPAYPLNSATVR